MYQSYSNQQTQSSMETHGQSTPQVDGSTVEGDGASKTTLVQEKPSRQFESTNVADNSNQQQSLVARHGESTPQVDGSTVEGDRASKTALVQKILPSPEMGTDTTPSVAFPGRDGDIPSSGAEPPAKRHKCRTGAQFHAENVICTPTGSGTSICLPSEPTVHLECDSLGVDNASTLTLSSEVVPVNIPRMSESEFLAMLEESDPWAPELPAFLEAYPPVNENTDSNYNVAEMEVSHYSSIPSLSEVASASHSETYDAAQPRMTVLETQGRSEVEENTVYPRIGELQHQGLPRRRLLIEKELTDTDIGTGTGGIKIPKDSVEMYFDAIPEGLQGHVITIHDAVTVGKKWIVRLTVFAKLTSGPDRSQTYYLKDIGEYLKHHALREGDWLQLFWEEPHKRYIVKFERSSSQHFPPAHQRHLYGKTWKIVIRKRLTQNDAFVGCRCVGSTGIMKKKAEKHLPPMDNTEGVEIKFFDWDNQETWTMKVTRSGKTVVYKLEGSAAFCKFHHLLKDDYLEIFKSEETNASYAIRGCKLDDRA